MGIFVEGIHFHVGYIDCTALIMGTYCKSLSPTPLVFITIIFKNLILIIGLLQQNPDIYSFQNIFEVAKLVAKLLIITLFKRKWQEKAHKGYPSNIKGCLPFII